MKQYKEVIDGQAAAPKGAVSIKQILGGKGFGPYEQDTVDEFQASLKRTNMADLQALCSKVGLRPSSDRSQMIARLSKQYIRDRSSYAAAKRDSTASASGDKAARARQILRRGV